MISNGVIAPERAFPRPVQRSNVERDGSLTFVNQRRSRRNRSEAKDSSCPLLPNGAKDRAAYLRIRATSKIGVKARKDFGTKNENFENQALTISHLRAHFWYDRPKFSVFL